MEIQHLSHEHPLIFTEAHDKDNEDGNNGKEVKCKGCLELLSGGPSYTCRINECNFKLHKSCAELSRQINHPVHPEHPLTLSGVPAEYRLAHRCYACKQFSMGSAYSCSVCKFNIDIICSQKPQTIKHTKHQHPLTTLRTALFLCDACGLEHEGVSQLCSTCKFWINKSCASLPDTVKHDHDHPLTICYSFPQEYYDFVTRCDIFSENLNKTYWTYFCAKCRYFAHLNCATATATATSQEEPFEDKETDIEINPIPLPVIDESVDLIAYFFNLGHNKRTTELNHFSHEHPLVLFDTQITDEFCSESNKLSLPNETENTEACNACVQPISAPFYHCAHCKFFLHQSCAELPLEVRHSSHLEHPLTLLARNPLTKKRDSWCNACHVYHSNWSFGYETCNFNLHSSCAMLPRTIKHRYDEEHPFALHYVPVKDHLAEYYCEIFCNELNPKHWFYHCDECDLSNHAECMTSLYDRFANIKFGETIEVDDHSHLLTFVLKTKGDAQCNYCPGSINLYPPLAFECAECDFKVHFQCAETKVLFK